MRSCPRVVMRCPFERHSTPSWQGWMGGAAVGGRPDDGPEFTLRDCRVLARLGPAGMSAVRSLSGGKRTHCGHVGTAVFDPISDLGCADGGPLMSGRGGSDCNARPDRTSRLRAVRGRFERRLRARGSLSLWLTTLGQSQPRVRRKSFREVRTVVHNTWKMTAVDQPNSRTPFMAVIGPSKRQCSTGTTSPYPSVV
jgi:hypothetical protein